MSDAQIDTIRKFVAGGGALIATGQTSLFDQWGDPRPDFALADLLGVSGGKPAPANPTAAGPRSRGGGPAAARHSYLRLTPELRAQFYGPKTGDEPAATPKTPRHPCRVRRRPTSSPSAEPCSRSQSPPQRQTLLTFVPEFEPTPPEISYMRQPRTNIPGLVINENATRPRRISRRRHRPPLRRPQFPRPRRPARQHHSLGRQRYHSPGRAGPGPAQLRAIPPARTNHPACVESHQRRRLAHPVEELIPVGPMKIAIKLPPDIQPKTLRLLVSGEASPVNVDSGWARFEIKSVLDHELVVLES